MVRILLEGWKVDRRDMRVFCSSTYLEAKLLILAIPAVSTLRLRFCRGSAPMALPSLLLRSYLPQSPARPAHELAGAFYPYHL